MLSLILTVGLFVYWTLVGYAVITSLHATRSRLQNLLLAPVVGVATLVVPLFILNRLGLPIKSFAAVLAAVLLVGALIVVFKTRPGVPWRRAWPYLGVIVLALGTVASPMLRYGLDWVSFCNDDMTNYCLAGERVYHDGYFTPPPAEAFAHGRYDPGRFWFMHVVEEMRPGSEMTLAWLRGVVGLLETQAFMSLICSYQLALLLATAALVESAALEQTPPETEDKLESSRRMARLGHVLRPLASPSLLASAMLAVSALGVFAMLYQLIAQVLGLSLLMCVSVLIMRPLTEVRGMRLVRHVILLGWVSAAMLIVYPEVTPFAALGLVGYLIIAAARRQLSYLRMGALIVGGAAVAAVLLRGYLFSAARILLLQARAGTNVTGEKDAMTQLFPYYLLPTGLGNFWGFLGLAHFEDEPYQTIAIVVGAALLVLTIVAALWLWWRGRAIACIALVMTALAFTLLRHQSGFGLYKLAMYAQPFAIGVLVLAWCTLVRNGALRILPLAVLACFGSTGLRQYVSASAGRGSGFVEVRDPSRSRFMREFQDILEKHPDADVVISDSNNLVLVKFQAMYTQGRELIIPTSPVFAVIRSPLRAEARPEIRRMADELEARQAQILLSPAKFNLHQPDHPNATNGFNQSDQGRTLPGDQAHALLVETTAKQGLFNRTTMPGAAQGNFLAMPLAEARNHLVFLSSDLGAPYYGPRDKAAVYQLESDPLFFIDQTMSGVGRYMLLQIINPAPRVRLALTMTCSFQGDRRNSLPPAEVIGAKRWALPTEGQGSMRVYSPPIEPQVIGGRSYIMLDMGVNGERIKLPRTNLMKVFARDISIDRRFLVGFARDISAVSDEEYRQLAPPSRLSGFGPGKHNPLRNPSLEYCGIYEDGWIGDGAWMRLTQPTGVETFVIRGRIPLMGQDPQSRMTLELSVDGQTVPFVVNQNGAKAPDAVLAPGDFVVSASIPASQGSSSVRRIHLRLKGPTLHLPDADGRPIMAGIDAIGFEAPPEGLSNLKASAESPLRNPEVRASGIDEDGWLAPEASLRLTQPPGTRTLVIQGNVPAMPDSAGHTAQVVVTVDGQQIAQGTIGVGDFELRGPVLPGGKFRTIGIRFIGPALHLPSPDHRTVAAFLKSIQFADPIPPSP